MADLKVYKWDKKRYQIINPSKGVYRLVRVIGEYENKDDAISDLFDVSKGIKTEEEIMEQRLKNYFE